MFWAIGRITRAVPDTPVTADIESGYGLPPEQLVEQLLGAGAVGCNLEDTDHARGGNVLRSAEAQAERLRAVIAAAGAAGVAIVINARVDVFLRSVPGDLYEAIRRARTHTHIHTIRCARRRRLQRAAMTDHQHRLEAIRSWQNI